MSVNDIRIFPLDQPAQQEERSEHHTRVSGIHRHNLVTYAVVLDFPDINSATGSHENIITPPLQFFRQLYDMGFGAADVESHGYHKYFLLHHFSIPMTVPVILQYFV